MWGIGSYGHDKPAALAVALAAIFAACTRVVRSQPAAPTPGNESMQYADDDAAAAAADPARHEFRSSSNDAPVEVERAFHAQLVFTR